MSVDKEIITNILENARGLIENGWTQNHYARDGMGSPYNVNHLTGENCKCYCISGAVERGAVIATQESEGSLKLSEAIDACEEVIHGVLKEKYNWHPEWSGSYIAWNDCRERTREDVLALLVNSIELLKRDS